MALPKDTIRQADFSPNIKTYTLLYVAFFMFISVVGIFILPFWFLGLGQYVSRRYYESLSCRLTAHHLQFKKGVLFKVEKTVPLENIQDLTFIENPLLKLLQLKIIKIETASQSHPMKSDMQLVGIMETDNFKDAVLAQRELLSKPNQGSNAGSMDNTEVVELLRDIKSILLEIKKQ